MYDNKFETQKNKKNEPRIKLNYNICVVVNFSSQVIFIFPLFQLHSHTIKMFGRNCLQIR